MSSEQYFHSIRVEEDRCDGRMKCMRICPTHAIRIRHGKAYILEDRCIDCGECITICPENAIIPLTDPIGELSKFRHTVAIPSPTLFAQFGRDILPHEILAGLKKLGFDDAFDLINTCGKVSFAIQEYLREHKGPKPIIFNACPTVVRLIQVKYPSLIDHVISLNIPRELAGREVKKKKAARYGIEEKEIGTFYITPCPVKMISIKQPAEKGRSYLDGAISIADIYGPLLSAMEDVDQISYQQSLQSICILGIGWTVVGGISRTLRLKNSLSVSGISEIIKVFNDIERGKLKHIDFIEAYSCPQGCVGGSLTVENRYISFNKITKIIETLEYEDIKACPDVRDVRKLFKQKFYSLERKIKPRPLEPLDGNLSVAIQKKKEKEKIFETLPKIDCGACGSPTCLSFAEDVVRNRAKTEDCLFILSVEYQKQLKTLKNNKRGSGQDRSKNRKDNDQEGKNNEA